MAVRIGPALLLLARSVGFVGKPAPVIVSMEPMGHSKKKLLGTMDRSRIRNIIKLIQDLGFNYTLDRADNFAETPLLRGADLYNTIMDSEKCKVLIDKLREYQMKAFK